MRRLALAIAALALLCTPAAAQTISRSQTGAVGTVVSCTDPNSATVKCVLPMAIPVTSAGVEKGTTTSPQAVAGNVASAGTDAGNPVKVGGVYNTTSPTFTNGQRGDLQVGTRGSLNVQVCGADTNTCIIASSPADAQSTGSGLIVRSQNTLFNGATWDRAFTCSNTAVVNVTAGATTQLVALSGATQIRVCSLAITMSAAGTAKFVYGTGANCGTGTTDITGAMPLATGTPLAISGVQGSVLRGAASNALCLAAVTGNVTGFVTYAQF